MEKCNRHLDKKEKGVAIDPVGTVASKPLRQDASHLKITGLAQKADARVSFKPLEEENLRLQRGDRPKLSHNKEKMLQVV